ncbi:alcohol acetyltransferase [Aspergillus floccosus]
MEQYSTARHHLKYYNNVAVAATYSLPESFILPVQDYVFKACEALVGQHPVLSAIPLREDTKEPYWARLPEVDLGHAVHFKQRTKPVSETDNHDSELDELLQEQHNTPYTAPHPYWRLCVLTEATEPRRFTAAFVFHHALGDGTSGKVFHLTFLQALRSAASLAPSEAKQTITSPNTPLLPSLEEAHPLPISFGFLASTVWNQVLWPSRKPGLWTGSDVRLPLATRIRHIAFPESTASAFRKLCRQNGTTVTATLDTLISRALFRHLPAQFTQLQTSVPMSLRRLLPSPISDESIGVWVSDIKGSYERSALETESFPWNEAKRARETIEKAVNLQGKDTFAALLRLVNNIHKYFTDKIGKPRDSSLEVSNIGAVVPADVGNDTIPQIGRIVFTQCGSVIGSALETCVVTGGDGCLVWAFCWQEGVVEEELVMSAIETVKTELNCLCSA